MPTSDQKEKNRIRRQKWLANPANRERDRAAARERYYRKKNAAMANSGQTLLPL